MALENVDWVLPVVTDIMPIWATVRDCIDGQSAIKAEGTKYLPVPNAGDKSEENLARYDAYKTRGLFINMTARTLNGMVGTAFSKEPVFTAPPELDILMENVDGGAVTLDQQAKQVLSDALSVGRCGLLADYPAVGDFVSAAQINSGEVRPVIQFYFAEDIINWRYETVNAKRKLVFLVLREKRVVIENEFKHSTVDQWRVLRLENGQYTAEVIIKNDKGQFVSDSKFTPVQKGRKPFDAIPFEFVGSRNNDGGIDEVPLIGLADLNIAHYRNSCDFEEMVFILGQPTTVIAGLSQSWATDVLKGKVLMGSSTALMLPEGATATYLQVNESQLALEAMKHKETQAVAIGAKLVSQSTVQRTAKEAGMDDASEQSVLLSAVYNVNQAYKRIIGYCAMFVGAAVTEDLGYELNTDFEIMQLDQAALTARVKMWTDGAIVFEEMRSILRRAGIATLDDEEAKKLLEEEAAANNAAMGLGPDGLPLVDPAAPAAKPGDGFVPGGEA